MAIKKQKVKIEYDKDLDLLIAHLSNNIKNPIETRLGPFDGNVLFNVDSLTGELINITIYDFSVIKKELMKYSISLISKKLIEVWLNTIADTYRSVNGYTSEVYA